MAHCIPLLARLCKEKYARVSFDGFSLLAFRHSYLLDRHILIPLYPILLPLPEAVFFFFFWSLVHPITVFHVYSGVREGPPQCCTTFF